MNLGIIRERKERKKKVPRPSHGSSFLFRGVSWERNLHPRWETVSNKQVVKNVYIYIYYYTHTFEENEKSSITIIIHRLQESRANDNQIYKKKSGYSFRRWRLITVPITKASLNGKRWKGVQQGRSLFLHPRLSPGPVITGIGLHRGNLSRL